MSASSEILESDADTSNGHLSVQQVSKIYDPYGAHVEALRECSLEIPAGDFIAVVGPSGCGKSTLLNILAGFDNLTGGQVLLDGAPLATLDHPPRPGSDRVQKPTTHICPPRRGGYNWTASSPCFLSHCLKGQVRWTRPE